MTPTPYSSSYVSNIAIDRCRHVCLIRHGRPRTDDIIAEKCGHDRGLHGLGKGSGTQSSPFSLQLSAIVQFGIWKTPIEHVNLSTTKFLPILFLGQGCGGDDCDSTPRDISLAKATVQSTLDMDAVEKGGQRTT